MWRTGQPRFEGFAIKRDGCGLCALTLLEARTSARLRLISARQILLQKDLELTPRFGRSPQEDQPMNDRVERRTEDRDPLDVLSPEVFALLKLCGDVRATDLPQKSEGRQRHGESFDRRRSERRSSESDAHNSHQTSDMDRRRHSESAT
jgi:hypothetical protein